MSTAIYTFLVNSENSLKTTRCSGYHMFYKVLVFVHDNFWRGFYFWVDGKLGDWND